MVSSERRKEGTKKKEGKNLGCCALPSRNDVVSLKWNGVIKSHEWQANRVDDNASNDALFPFQQNDQAFTTHGRHVVWSRERMTSRLVHTDDRAHRNPDDTPFGMHANDSAHRRHVVWTKLRTTGSSFLYFFSSNFLSFFNSNHFSLNSTSQYTSKILWTPIKI